MTSVTDSTPIYRDASRPVSERVADLLGRMTTVEKAAQLGSAWVFHLAAGTELADGAPALLEHGLGQVTRISGASTLRSGDAATVANRVQEYLVGKTRLGIPAVVHEEVCAGLMAREATVFPQPIGLASTWQPDLVEQMTSIVRVEMRAMGAHQGLSPVLDVTRDPRWGRVEETFGEDPHLVACMGMAFIRGLQGTSPNGGVIATAKHFVGYSASEGGLNWAPASIPPRELREVYLHPFEAAVRSAGVGSVMNAYHEIDGLPCGANGDLLTGILRRQWGFEGQVVADYFAVRQLEDYHHLARNRAEAAAMALTAGIDVELPVTDCYGDPLVDAVEQGAVSVSVLDLAVERVLRAKFELGLFEDPYVDAGVASSKVGVASHRRLAATLAAKSIVLLGNDGCLPLDPATTGSVAVIGPNAGIARHLLGDYSYPAHIETLRDRHEAETAFSLSLLDDPSFDDDMVRGQTVFEALAARLPAAAVGFAAGCDVSGPSRDGFDQAVQLATEADVAVLVVGDKAGLTLDATSGESRDRSSLDLPGVQEDLVEAVLATGTPVVLVLVAGRPCGSARIHERCAAVVAAWLPGVEGAAAVADVLVGATNPGGKLPMSFPRSAGHIPVYYGHKVSGGRSHWKGDYVDAPVSPLYPFGHGLSFTTFELAATAPQPAEVGPGGEITVEVAVTNTGERDGDEVVQLYVRDVHASVTRPVLELKGFARVAVPAGGEQRLTFTVPVAQLGFYDRRLRYVVEPGEFEVHVGQSATELSQAGTFTVTGHEPLPVTKVFDGRVVITGT
jgi:beta-glucosidase